MLRGPRQEHIVTLAGASMIAPTKQDKKARISNRLLIFCLILIAFGAGFFKVFHRRQPALFQIRPIAKSSNDEPRFRSHFVSTRKYVHTHAASLIELKDGRIRAFWFSGSLEGSPDVEIHSAVFDPDRDQWGPEHKVANGESTRRSVLRRIKRIGNPVPGRAADGTLWLFYVTVSVGGWSGSSITAMTSSDEGETWSPARRLISSPFLNNSTLVKGTPFLYADGTLGLPVYHQFIGRFGELLHLDSNGAVIDKQRLSAGDYSLQPIVLIRSAREALALLRYSGAEHPYRVISTMTNDAGQHWTPPVKSSLSNPGAALSGVVLPDGRILVALNNLEKGRDLLSLVISGDGGTTWRTVYPLEDQLATRLNGSPDQCLDEAQYLRTIEGLARATDPTVTEAGAYSESTKRQMCEAQRCSFEFSYPYLIQTQRGDFHLVYTWNRSFIKHVRFNQSWLERRLGKPADGQLH
jgi:predicted neuraminidase